jgi:Na+-transporting NADH:ubiquinone oxidoreductase subunit NqrA
MSARNIAERVGPEVAAPRPFATQMERLDRTIEEAEMRLDEQETLIGQAALAGRDTAQDSFELHKMQLLVAILREGRERLLERLPPSV